MGMLHRSAIALAALAAMVSSGSAADKLTVALVGTYAWDSSPAVYGKKLGFFADAGIDLSIAETDSNNDSMQAVIAGSADLGVVSTPAFIGAAQQGAPIVVIASLFKGYPDFLWYVRADSKLQSFKDVTPETKIGISSVGAGSYIALNALLQQYGMKADVIATGSPTASLTQVMAGQIDAGTDGNGLLGVPEWNDRKIRVLAYGNELTSLANVTVRALAVTRETLANRRDLLVRYLQAYQKSVDWMYSHPEAVQWFADQTQASLEEAKRVVGNCYPAAAMKVGDVTGIEAIVKMGLDFKRIARQPTDAELADMFQTVWKAP